MRLHQNAWMGRVAMMPQPTPRLAGAPRRVQLGRGWVLTQLNGRLDVRFEGHLGSQLGQGQNTESQRARGPILPIQVGLPQAAEASMRQNGDTPGTMEEVQALVDTGASITAINEELAARLGLIPTGSVQVGGVTGVDTRPLYGARIVMPEPGFTFDPVQIVGANLNAPDFQILIGRNLLCSMLMTYDGPRGQFALTK